MKRVQSAFLQQTLRFTPKEGIDPKYAAQAVQDEITQYKNRMDRTRVAYRILKEETQKDGTVILEIKKQYSNSPVGNYLD